MNRPVPSSGIPQTQSEMPAPATLANLLSSIPPDFVVVDDLNAYAEKIARHGKCLSMGHSGAPPEAMILYYDNRPEIFVSMVWTSPECRRRGFARHLLRILFSRTRKPVRLSVHRRNPARSLYETLGFTVVGSQDDRLTMERTSRVAIMQPYFFPYIGYFQLAEASDHFVFFDDVSFINRGWINRNRILVGGSDHMLTVPLSKASQNRRICDISVSADPRWIEKAKKTLRMAYARAPMFEAVMSLMEQVLDQRHDTIARLSAHSVQAVCSYVGLPLPTAFSSEAAAGSQELAGADRMIAIARKLGFEGIVNAPGGRELYRTKDFRASGVNLEFVIGQSPKYAQFGDDWIPNLSIIDVLMFNPPADARRMMQAYRLESADGGQS